MPLSLSFGNRQNYQISDSSVALMMSSSRAEATYMGPVDKIKDLFRTEKKAAVLNELYNLVHGEQGKVKLDAFNLLKTYSDETCQNTFVKKIDDSGNFLFSINGHNVGSCSLEQAMNLPEDSDLKPMEEKEKQLFLSILEKIHEKNNLMLDSSPQRRRDAVACELRDDIYNLYRPSESVESKESEWAPPAEFRDEDASEIKCLNAGTFDPTTQFSKIGYQQTMNGIEFKMMHPSISYLLGTYTDLPDFTAVNLEFLKILNGDYAEYTENKFTIDQHLQKIFNSHQNTLNIAINGQNRNRLV